MTLAILGQLCLLVYHQVTTWFDLFPFNGVRYTRTRERVIEAIVNLLLMSIAPIGFALGYEALMKFGLIYYFILFAIECATWWAPYAFGASKEWQEVYTRVHSATINVLPAKDGRPRPNLEHLILMLLTLAVAVSTRYEFAALHPGPLPSLWIGWGIGALLTAGTTVQMVYGTRSSVSEAKKANQPSEPTAMSVTPPAAQEPRQP